VLSEIIIQELLV